MPANEILIIGQSLGSGVASLLTLHLEQSSKVLPMGLVSICGFTNIPAAAFTFPWLKLVFPFPVFYLRHLDNLFHALISERLDTKRAITV